MNFEMRDQSGIHDIPNHRVVELENGNKLNLVRKDPYGFIYIHLDRGGLPPWLGDAAFTDWFSARQACDKYIRERQDVVAEIELQDKEPKKK